MDRIRLTITGYDLPSFQGQNIRTPRHRACSLHIEVSRVHSESFFHDNEYKLFQGANLGMTIESRQPEQNWEVLIATCKLMLGG